MTNSISVASLVVSPRRETDIGAILELLSKANGPDPSPYAITTYEEVSEIVKYYQDMINEGMYPCMGASIVHVPEVAALSEPIQTTKIELQGNGMGWILVSAEPFLIAKDHCGVSQIQFDPALISDWLLNYVPPFGRTSEYAADDTLKIMNATGLKVPDLINYIASNIPRCPKPKLNYIFRHLINSLDMENDTLKSAADAFLVALNLS